MPSLFDLALRRVGKPFTVVYSKYIHVSVSRPYLTAMVTGGTILTISDCAAQYFSSWGVYGYKHDWRRTFALCMFGTFYYGTVARAIYAYYEWYFGVQQVLQKTIIDCCIHGPLIVVPCFYFMTGVIKGESLTDIHQQFKREFMVTAVGTLLYWIPVMFISFRFFTQHTRILYITSLSLAHKTALSWFTNRNRMNERLLKLEKEEESTINHAPLL